MSATITAERESWIGIGLGNADAIDTRLIRQEVEDADSHAKLQLCRRRTDSGDDVTQEASSVFEISAVFSCAIETAE